MPRHHGTQAFNKLPLVLLLKHHAIWELNTACILSNRLFRQWLEP